MHLEPGQLAPDFTLKTHDESTLSLGDFKGKNIVLYFYPKDDTPGCTLESCAFRDSLQAFTEKGAVILGISRDTVSSHRKFHEKYNLNFPLLSDVDGTACEAYGVMGEKRMYGKIYHGIIRSTFLVGADGHIRNIWTKVSVPGHVAEVLKALEKAV